jgi:hypothetical protein
MIPFQVDMDMISRLAGFRNKPGYDTPDGTICPECGEPCYIVPLDNSFDYSGTHCTHGRSGTHRPDGYGSPVSDCCEVPIEV